MPVSAQVFETGGAAAPVPPVSGAVGAALGAGAAMSPVSTVPGASLLAPSLNSAILSAFPGHAATNLPAGAVRLAPAPIPALPAAAAVSAAPALSGGRGRESSPRTSDAPSRRDMVPPSGVESATALRAVAADRRRGAAGHELAAPGEVTGGLDLLSAEGSAELGRKLFDRVEDRPALAGGAAGGAPGEFISDGPSPVSDPLLTAANGAASDVETLRDAVASPFPAAAPSGAAFSFFRLPGSLFAPSRNAPSGASGAAPPSAPVAAPVSFERLSLQLGSGLVVKVRAALGFAPSAAALSPSATANGKSEAARPASRFRAPITSTEWLERRGLLESLSVSEAAASQEAAARAAPVSARSLANGLGPAAVPRAAAAPARPFAPSAPARVPPLAWWALAFLPAGLVLLKELS